MPAFTDGKCNVTRNCLIPRGVSESPRGVSETPRGVLKLPVEFSKLPVEFPKLPVEFSETPRGVSIKPRGVSETPRGVSKKPRGIKNSTQNSTWICLLSRGIFLIPREITFAISGWGGLGRAFRAATV